MKLEKQYIIYFEQFFKNVREEFNKSVKYCPDDELSSGELAHKKAICSLPCPVKVVRIKVETEKYNQANDSIYHLIAFELSDLGKSKVIYYGEIDIDEIDKQSGLLNSFKLDQADVEELKTFKIQSYADLENWHYVTVVPYDILDKPAKHARDFRWSFLSSFSREILQRFETIIDFNSKYGLKSDPVFSVPELLQKDKTFSGFVKIDGYGNRHEITIEDMQKDICNIQLISPVPEDVRKVFNGAKKLYVLGYFDYYLFTVSEHYAFLALESALRNRYHELHGESRKFIRLDNVIKDLVKNNVIPGGETQLYLCGGVLRNELSHLTKQKVVSPQPGILESVAYQINYLYYK